MSAEDRVAYWKRRCSVAENELEWAKRDMAHSRQWAENCHGYERRLSDRCTYLYGLAARHGATDAELRGPDVAIDVETACEIMHDAYEIAAVGAGWETQAASRKPWADVPEANKQTMRAAVGALLDRITRQG